MKRTVSLLATSVLVGTTAVVVATSRSAEAEPVIADASNGTLTICHRGLGTEGRISETFGAENLNTGTAISGTSTIFRNARGCSTAADGIEDRMRFRLSHRVKDPYRLKSVRVQQTDGAAVTVAARSGSVSILMDEDEQVTVTFNWVRPKRR